MIENKFGKSENIFFTVVAKLKLEVHDPSLRDPKHVRDGSDEHEHYHFIYNRQQLPLNAYQQSQIETIPYHWLFILIFVITLAFLLIVFIFTRKVVPLLARLKAGGTMVEEPEEPQDDLAVPPSSDRNQIAPQVAIETEEGMK